MLAALPLAEDIAVSSDELAVVHVTLNRRQSRNALSARMVMELTSLFDHPELSNARAVVIRGAGGNFCAGGDVNDMSALLADARAGTTESVVQYSALAGELFHKINDSSLPVIAVVEGAVLGGGVGLACAADIVLADSGARFSLPEARLGLVPAQIAPFVVRRIGESNARLMAVSGSQFDAVWAQRVGLVNYLVNRAIDGDSALEQALTRTLLDIRACAPKALSVAKNLMCLAAVDEDGKHSNPQALGAIFAYALAGEEAMEGTASFVEKRKPRWQE